MLQTYDEYINPLTMEDKKKVHEDGLWHKVVTGILYNKAEKTIIFQTIYPKDYGFERPDYLDFTVGGHVEDNEDVNSALKREAKEEVGLNLLDNSKFSFIHIVNCDPNPSYKIREFQYIYILNTEDKFEKIGEYLELKSLFYVEVNELLELIKNKKQEISSRECIYGRNDRKLREKKERIITIKDFIPDYITNGLLEKLLYTVKGYMEGEG